MNQRGDNCVLIFVKYPADGKVKTRLAQDLGGQIVCEIYKRFVEDLLDMLDDLGVDFEILFDPPDAREQFGQWLGTERKFLAQAGDDLGERMRNAFLHYFSKDYKRIVIIGSDSPDLPSAFIERGLESLNDNDAVIGPSSDGGYYMIGFSTEGFLKEAFEDIIWSGEDVCRVTIEKLQKHERKLDVLEQWHDVDTLEDLKSLILRSKDTDFENSRTISYLNSLDIK
jgi:rSAM/selenodomain-associated transferase 1